MVKREIAAHRAPFKSSGAEPVMGSGNFMRPSAHRQRLLNVRYRDQEPNRRASWFVKVFGRRPSQVAGLSKGRRTETAQARTRGDSGRYGDLKIPICACSRRSDCKVSLGSGAREESQNQAFHRVAPLMLATVTIDVAGRQPTSSGRYLFHVQNWPAAGHLRFPAVVATAERLAAAIIAMGSGQAFDKRVTAVRRLFPPGTADTSSPPSRPGNGRGQTGEIPCMV
jgi:hypothetical protein